MPEVALYTDGRIYTQDPRRPLAEALLCVDGTLVAVGTRAEVLAHPAAAGAERMDLAGAVVIPGLVDAHVHAWLYGLALNEVDLREARSRGQALRAVAEFAAATPGEEWITGGRWDVNTWANPELPNRGDLDAVVPDRPVALSSLDHHTLWLNSAALAAAGISDGTPAHTSIERDERGRPTGIVRENAGDVVFAAIPVPPAGVRAAVLAGAQREFLSVGLTGVHDIDGRISREAWEYLRAGGNQDIRVHGFLREEELDAAIADGWRSGAGDEWFSRGPLKLFSDGALGSHTSHMGKAFPGEEGNTGIEVTDVATLVRLIGRAERAGIAVGVHAIGDQANHLVLDAFAEVAESRDPAAPVPRHRVEHAQLVRREDVARFAELGITASMQPRHCISDLELIRSLLPGTDLAAYAWKEFGALAFGSDGPVEPSNPFAAIYAAMTRADIGGDPGTTFQPEQRMSAAEAIAAHTIGPAAAAGIEDRAGRLRPGMFADFVVIDVDPYVAEGLLADGSYASEQQLFVHAAALRDAVVALTVVGGKVRHRR